MNIIQAVHDRALFNPFLGDLSTWRPWLSVLRALYGLSLDHLDRETLRQITGRRSLRLLPPGGFDEALFLTGRRSGKSRAAAIVGVFEALFGGHESRLAPGEIGCVACISPTRFQSQILRSYMRALFHTPLLAGEVTEENKDGFILRNGLRIFILTGDYRAVRGFTLVAAIVDETAFFGLTEESKVKSDTELLRALKPGLATTGGKLVCISSPYAKKGYCYTTWKKNFGNDAGRVLVVNCPSRRMNPTLSQRIVDAAYLEDKCAAASEYGGEFREDIADYTTREIVEAAVIPGRTAESVPVHGARYSAFADCSGGRSDSFSMAIVHRAGARVVVDSVFEARPPLSPYEVVPRMVEVLRRFGVRKVIGDAYAGEWVSRAFDAQGVTYTKSAKPKSDLYIDFLPILQAKLVELPDLPRLVDQLASLERRTHSGGRDVVRKPSGNTHDDIANAVSGAVVLCQKGTVKVGGLNARGGAMGGNRLARLLRGMQDQD